MDEAEIPTISSGNLSRKVIFVAAGEAHTLALSGDGRVYAWGRGTFGRLGTGNESDELCPVRVAFGKDGIKFVGIAAGAYHSLALADDGSVWCWGYNTYDGSVWCWGYNTYGQLGFDGENSLVPRFLEDFYELGANGCALTDESETKNKSPLKVSSVSAGGMMSFAIDSLGGLWMWGNCPPQSSSEDEEFSLVSSPTPAPVWDFHGHTVVKVDCGNEHVVALVSAGETHKGDDLICFTWGSNSHGQLGLGDRDSRYQPQIVETFDQKSPWAVYEVACGAFHTALLTHRKRPSTTLESMCWTFGLGENGQLGHGTTQSALVPEHVQHLPENIRLVSVDCGLFHTSVVSSVGDVWSWGMEKGLGLCPEATYSGTDSGDAIYPLAISATGIDGPKFKEPVQVTCGAAHTVLVTDGGYKLWAWGRGSIGVLGHGKMVDSFVPTMLLWPPLSEDFEEEYSAATILKKRETQEDSNEVMSEVQNKLSAAMEEMELLKLKLFTMERYAGILHGSIFGKPFEDHDIPPSLRTTGTFNIAKEWESMLESADRDKLVWLETFYRNMLSGVKDKLLKRRIQEIVIECLPPTTSGS